MRIEKPIEISAQLVKEIHQQDMRGTAPKQRLPIDGRIAGGTPTNITKHPWLVAVGERSERLCGGFFITRSWIATAAHCLTGIGEKLTVRAGADSWFYGGVKGIVDTIVIHPEYNESNFDNDIALLRLENPIYILKTEPATLPEAGQEVPTGANLTVAGWGFYGKENPFSMYLREVTVPVISRDDCQKAYSVSQITERTICAGADGKDYCKQDAGGAAVVDGKVVGIASWGEGCGDPKKPGVYTNVASFREWIKEITTRI
ncbi:hypothetical protein JTB14_027703 [Gonioctena quinquepunctata]|nr:hypothetical protein JTB14_027703 [Gonioctena quinquepunctata]